MRKPLLVSARDCMKLRFIHVSVLVLVERERVRAGVNPKFYLPTQHH